MLSYEAFITQNTIGPFPPAKKKDESIDERRKKRNMTSSMRHRERKRRYVEYLQDYGRTMESKYKKAKSENLVLKDMLKEMEQQQCLSDLPPMEEDIYISDSEFERQLSLSFYDIS
jgi:hypothetical protein